MESSTESQSHKLPALLWDSLQSVCFSHDQQFLRDVARITGLNERDLKVKLLGRCGMPTAIVVEKGPWWLGSACAAMERGNGGLWRRCGAYRDADGFCHTHRKHIRSSDMKRFDDPYFASLRRRKPVDLEGEIVWVCDIGSVLTSAGLLRDDVRIDLNTGTATMGKDGFTKSESEAKCASKEGAGTGAGAESSSATEASEKNGVDDPLESGSSGTVPATL